MGREFEPYHPRPVTLNWEGANQFGAPSPILEIPVSWYLADFPPQEYVAGLNAGLGYLRAAVPHVEGHLRLRL